MKTVSRVILLPILILMLATLTGCVGIPDFGPGLVLGESYRLESGQTLNTDLTVVGGNATVEPNATVNGDVAVIGGNVTVDGKVNGDLTVVGGFVYLEDHAEIKGNVDSLGGTVQRASGARVEGQNIDRGRNPRITTVGAPGMNISFEPVTATLMAIFQALAMAALAVLVSLFAPRLMERTGQAAVTSAPASGGVGCLTLLVLVIMAITIILLPVSLIGILAAGVAILFGWVALGAMVGRQLAVWLKQTWSEPVTAGAGTLTLSLLASLLNVIPCIGWLGSFLVGMVGLGAVVLTRFGTQPYPGFATRAYAPAVDTPAPLPTQGGAEVYKTPDQPDDRA